MALLLDPATAHWAEHYGIPPAQAVYQHSDLAAARVVVDAGLARAYGTGTRPDQRARRLAGRFKKWKAEGEGERERERSHTAWQQARDYAGQNAPNTGSAPLLPPVPGATPAMMARIVALLHATAQEVTPNTFHALRMLLLDLAHQHGALMVALRACTAADGPKPGH